MTAYRYYLPPYSKIPYIAAALSCLLCVNTAYLLISMPSYTQYFDYWLTLAASGLLTVTCLVLVRRHTRFVLIPTGLFALLGCMTPSVVHWAEVALFILLLLLLLVRLPAWMRPVVCIAGVVATVIGSIAVIVPVLERIGRLAETGRATPEFVIPYIIRTLAGDVLCLLSMLLLIFSLRPHRAPGWMDDDDTYDRIWE